MKELIPVHHTTIKNEIVLTADAREVHEFIQSRQEFANWIKDRIAIGGYEKDRDFMIILSKNPSAGRPSIEYVLTLDMAKELCMMERNEMGRLAHQVRGQPGPAVHPVQHQRPGIHLLFRREF